MKFIKKRRRICRKLTWPQATYSTSNTQRHTYAPLKISSYVFKYAYMCMCVQLNLFKYNFLYYFVCVCVCVLCMLSERNVTFHLRKSVRCDASALANQPASRLNIHSAASGQPTCRTWRMGNVVPTCYLHVYIRRSYTYACYCQQNK